MGFHSLSTDIGLHDLLPEAPVSPQINSSTVQTSITLKAVQTPPSPPPPPFLVPSRPPHFLWSAPLPQRFRVRPELWRALQLGWERGVAPSLGLAPRGCPPSCGNGGRCLVLPHSPLWLLMAAMKIYEFNQAPDR